MGNARNINESWVRQLTQSSISLPQKIKAAYLITIADASNYNVGKQLNIGIESQYNQHSFTNGTSAENIWTYPIGASGFQNYIGTAPIVAENNNRGWYSGWFPVQNGSQNAIQFLHP